MDAQTKVSQPVAPRPKWSFASVNLKSLANLSFLVVVIALWQIVSGLILPRLNMNAVTLMPPPSALIKALVQLVSSGDLFLHAGASLERTLVAFSAATGLAVPMGIAMGWSRPVYDQLNPVIELLRPIPPLAWIPLSILWFGIGNTQNEFIIFLGAFFPVLLNTIAGVKEIPPNLVRAAHSLGAGEWAILRKVVFKAALPHIFTGMRVGMGVGWMCLVAAEIVGASSGLGFLINDSRSMLRTDQVVVGMAAIGALGLIIDAIVRWVITRVMPWYRGVH